MTIHASASFPARPESSYGSGLASFPARPESSYMYASGLASFPARPESGYASGLASFLGTGLHSCLCVHVCNTCFFHDFSIHKLQLHVDSS